MSGTIRLRNAVGGSISLEADPSLITDEVVVVGKYPPELQAHLDSGGKLDWGGDTYIDSGAIGANPIAKIYPDGTIIGSTSYGNYTKRPDGTLTCESRSETLTTDTAVNTIFSANSNPMTFPIVFIEAPKITTVAYSTSNAWAGRAVDVTTTGVALFSLIAAYTGSTGSIVYQAVGRWK